MEPIFKQLSDPDLLKRVQRGDSQNPNEALHSLIWRRAPKHIFASPQIIRVSTALAVIHRNVGNVGLVRVMEHMGITNLDTTRQALEKLDVIKKKGLDKKKTPEARKRRQIVRGLRKKHQDHLEETEEPSYEAGGFDDPTGAEDIPGPSGVTKTRKPRKKKKDQTGDPDTEQPAKKKKGKQLKKYTTPDDSDDDASVHEMGESAEPTGKSTRERRVTCRFSIDDYEDFEDHDTD